MTINKITKAVAALLALFTIGASLYTQSYGVEANAAHHKVVKKHKPAKKHKAVKNSKKANKANAKKTPKFTYTDGQGIDISVGYSQKIYKAYNNQLIGSQDADPDTGQLGYALYLNGITYYKLDGKYNKRTAIVLNVKMVNPMTDKFASFFSTYGTIPRNTLINNDGDTLNSDFDNQSGAYAQVAPQASQFGKIIFVSNQSYPSSYFSQMNLNYEIASDIDTADQTATLSF